MFFFSKFRSHIRTQIQIQIYKYYICICEWWISDKSVLVELHQMRHPLHNIAFICWMVDAVTVRCKIYNLQTIFFLSYELTFLTTNTKWTGHVPWTTYTRYISHKLQSLKADEEKKWMTWERKIENETVNSNDATECTRTAEQSSIDAVVVLLHH